MWSTIWNSGIVNPMTNLLLLLYDVLGNNFFFALVAFTALTRLIMLPLSFRQQRSMQRTQEIQPQIQAIQKKYRDNPQKMQEEFQRIGYNPAETLTGCLPLLIQMPIFFGLYRAILFVLASSPQDLYRLSERAYDFVNLSSLLPVSNQFLWLNMAQPDPWFLLPVLVAGTMYLQQKLMTPAKKVDPKKKDAAPDTAAQMQQSMLVTMPLMFGFFALNFPAGLSVYFVVSNVIGIGQSYLMQRNMEQIKADAARKPRPIPVAIEAEPEAEPEPVVEKVSKVGKENDRSNEEKPDRKPAGKSRSGDVFQQTGEYLSAADRKQLKPRKRR
jgi:YidC/Oxa1 family membrane protein insertase